MSCNFRTLFFNDSYPSGPEKKKKKNIFNFGFGFVEIFDHKVVNLRCEGHSRIRILAYSKPPLDVLQIFSPDSCLHYKRIYLIIPLTSRGSFMHTTESNSVVFFTMRSFSRNVVFLTLQCGSNQHEKTSFENLVTHSLYILPSHKCFFSWSS